MSRIVEKFDPSGIPALVSYAEWIPLRFTDAATSRIVTRDASPDDVFTSFSTNRNKNTFTLSQDDSKLTSGTGAAATNCAVFSYPVVNSLNERIKLSDFWGVKFFIKVHSATASGVANDLFIAVGIFNGDLDLQGGRIASGLHYNNNTGPRVFSAGKGLSITAQQTSGRADLQTCRLFIDFHTMPTGSSRVLQRGTATAYADNGDYAVGKTWNSTSGYDNTTPRSTEDAFICLCVGRSSANANNPECEFEAYYQVREPPIYNGVLSSNPGV